MSQAESSSSDSPRGIGGQVLQADRLTARLHPALVVAFAGPREAGLEQVVAGQRLKALGQLSARELQSPPVQAGGRQHGRLEVVVDHPLGHATEVGEGAHVTVKEGELILALREPAEVAA